MKMGKAITHEAVIKLPNVRLSFAQSLFEASAFEEGQVKKYGATFLLDPEHGPHRKAVKQIKKAAAELTAQQDWDEDVKLKVQCFGLEDDARTGYDGWEDMFFIRAKNTSRPVTVNKDLTPVTESDGVIYSGCYVNATINLWSIHHVRGGKQINANLRGVQFVRDGEEFSGRPKVRAEEEFDPVDGDDEDDSVFG